MIRFILAVSVFAFLSATSLADPPENVKLTLSDGSTVVVTQWWYDEAMNSLHSKYPLWDEERLRREVPRVYEGQRAWIQMFSDIRDGKFNRKGDAKTPPRKRKQGQGPSNVAGGPRKGELWAPPDDGRASFKITIVHVERGRKIALYQWSKLNKRWKFRDYVTWLEEEGPELFDPQPQEDPNSDDDF